MCGLCPLDLRVKPEDDKGGGDLRIKSEDDKSSVPEDDIGEVGYSFPFGFKSRSVRGVFAFFKTHTQISPLCGPALKPNGLF